jgi:predicted glycosyltransferase
VNFASRPAILAAAAQRVPIFTIFDYEHVALPMVGSLSTTVCLPSAVSPAALAALGIPERKVLWFPATKEDLYASDFDPSPLRGRLEIPENALFALIRPPATTAHYHDPRSEAIYAALLDRVDANQAVHARVLGRTEEDRLALEARFPAHSRIRHLDSTGDGLNLIWNADLVVSGGGTMSREAAALGVPSFSIFTGPIGAVDQSLFDQGRVVHIGAAEGLDRIRFERRRQHATLPATRPDLVALLVNGMKRAAGAA